MVQWDDALPAKACQEGNASIFLVGGKGREVHGDEIGKTEEGQRES